LGGKSSQSRAEYLRPALLLCLKFKSVTARRRKKMQWGIAAGLKTGHANGEKRIIGGRKFQKVRGTGKFVDGWATRKI